MANTALIVIDMITPYDYPDADQLLSSAEAAVPAIERLIERASADDVPVIYVNDNFGSWTSNRDSIYQVAIEGKAPQLVEPLRPAEETMFVVKARHSIFFQTPLEYLLGQLKATRLVLTGQVTEQCVLYSALDAHIRHHDVVIPKDAVAHIHEELAEAALKMMELNMGANICAADGLELRAE
ncbi:cysteine hydrolase family protein [Cryptosporangium aurantiacum]|uniref:Nicotinamidase-related amidase n=1 Tax=Cryptosporangium aurantiacum TaxID=134849 RepID=A0A1M7NK82_9ACTN|nr:isochorismatase family cysteine hydrolase [Cryptosporangium aurantiacum]SHN04268.1 Nicotinamidase-related amidase [Cryptosporangium aurantiacum]